MNFLQSQEVFLMNAKYNFFNFEDKEESYKSKSMYFERELMDSNILFLLAWRHGDNRVVFVCLIESHHALEYVDEIVYKRRPATTQV